MEFRIDDGNELIRSFMEETESYDYEKSWDLLMPVIEKIEYIIEVEKPTPLHKILPCYYYIGLAHISLSLEGAKFHHIKPTIGTRKERNWKCCVGFIYWFNSNTK